MKYTHVISLIFGSVASLVTLASAQVPQMINYQGRVTVGDPAVNFGGTGEFKFALVNEDGSTSYWSNDGSSTDGSEPTGAVTLTVSKGLYSVLLGANMTPILPSVFTNADVRLRVWFDDGTNGSQLLTPDQRIAAVGYAMVASSLQPGVDITAGTVTATSFIGDGSGLTGVVGGEGTPGPTGDRGPQGLQGNDGPIGPQGLAGMMGDPGPASASPFSLSGLDAIYTQGNVGIGAASAPSHRLTLTNSSTDDVLRLVGPNTEFGWGARLNFGDGDFVYLDEPYDDGLRIEATEVGIGGDPVAGSSELQVFGTVAATAFVGDGSELTNLPSNTAESPDTVFPAQGMVWIRPGKFLMGSRTDEPGRGSDETQHWVTLTKGFWMGVHEVTQAEYVAVTGLANPSNFTGDTNRPVDSVSWTLAVAYCTTLTATERAAGRIPADWEYRLPTEAEWEYCSRAGARNTRFGYGDDIGATALADYAWYGSNSGSTTHPVEQKRPNAWGLIDMHGNVYEWCQDWYGAYSAGSATDPQGPGSGSNRVLRGGAWSSFAFNARCAYRNFYGPGSANYNYDIGFRAVLAPGQP